MSKQKKPQIHQGSNSFRNFKLIHQSLSITDVNFRKQILTGETELTFLPLTSSGKLLKLCVNLKQCRILRITVNDGLKATYSYMDPTLRICLQESKKRNLEFFDSCHGETLRSCDSDCTNNAGELIVKIPKDAYATSSWETLPIKVRLEFSLEQPKGGVAFVVPSTGSDPMRHAHVYTHSFENSSRLWFPCIDSHSEVCPWEISIVAPGNMMAVSCGELTNVVPSGDGKRRTFKYSLQNPTSAPSIGFAIGCFEVYPDPVMLEVTHFCLPGLMPILKNTVQFVHQVFGFYEELLSSRFPHGSYKLVFVEGLLQPCCRSYSTLGVFDTHLLHSARIVDHVIPTRRLIAEAVAMQYFGCYLVPQFWNDWWLTHGIGGYLAGLFSCKAFGNTEYMHWIRCEQQKVCAYEHDHTLPPLSIPSSSSHGSSLSGGRMNFHPKLVSMTELEVMRSKSHLVLHMIQHKIGQELLLQVFNKLLTLASSACQVQEHNLWQNLLASTEGFMKLLVTVSGKDMNSFMDQWVFKTGVPRLLVSYNFIRKKNLVELKIQQEVPARCSKFVGSMAVVVQEFDGCFPHNIQIEDLVSSHELPCHSKIRKAKKRKVPLIHGEEIEMDISSLDNEVPILWVQVDPDFQWVRGLLLEQSDTTWMNVLRYHRSANAQLDALEALGQYPSVQVRDSFREAVTTSHFYYNVRLTAAQKLAEYLSSTASLGSSPTFLIFMYQRLFGSTSHNNILRFNDFSDIASYFLQKGLAVCIAGMRNQHGQCPKEVVQFLLDLFKYNDNQYNKYSADYFTSSLIDALTEAVTPKVAMGCLAQDVDFAGTPTATLTKEAQAILQEVVQCLNIEKVLPSYRLVVTSSCLRCLRVLQKNGHIPSDSSIFREYAEKWNFVDVRKAAVEAIADIVQADHNEADLLFLLDMVESDDTCTRLDVLNALSANPPFMRRVESKLNNLTLVEKVWSMMSSGFYYDNILRSSVIQFYGSMYGRLTPSCVPQGLGIVIDLKEKVARSNFSSPITTPKTGFDFRAAATNPGFFPEDSSSVKISTLASGITSGMDLELSPPLLHVQSPKLAPISGLQPDPSLPHIPSPPSSDVLQPHISLKLQAQHLKQVGDKRSSTASPESVLSAGGSDDGGSPLSPGHSYASHKHKRHKTQHKHKHKKKKSKKTKHKHKHHQDIDVETL